MSTSDIIKPIEIPETFTSSGSNNSRPLTLDTLRWAIETFNTPDYVNLPDTEDLTREEITSIRSFYSGSGEIHHYNSVSDLLKKLKK